jgi:hypothetical protein
VAVAVDLVRMTAGVPRS